MEAGSPYLNKPLRSEVEARAFAKALEIIQRPTAAQEWLGSDRVTEALKRFRDEDAKGAISISPSLDTTLYIARDLARGLAIMSGNPFEPSEIEREDDQVTRYEQDEKRYERNYRGPKKEVEE